MPKSKTNNRAIKTARGAGSELGGALGSAPQPRVVTSCFDGCGSSHLSETNNYYVCRHCGMTYSKNKAAVTQGPNDRAMPRLTDPKTQTEKP